MNLRDRILGLFCTLVGLVLSGCAGGRYSVEYHEDRPARRQRDHVHVCTRNCRDDYYNGDRRVILKGHHHRDGCGHRWNGTHWVIYDPGPRRYTARHVCSRGCNRHYYNGTKLVVLNGHRHGPGCGHYWDGTYWVAARRAHSARPIRKAYPHSGVRRSRRTPDSY